MSGERRTLGVEGGGTKTSWVLLGDNASVTSGKLPPSNFRLTTPEQLARIFALLPREAEAVGIFLAGCSTEADRSEVRELAREIWPTAKLTVGSDREAEVAAALGARDGIVVNAGTGSSVTGRRGDRIEKAGGWGHILGDAGGGYFISIGALRQVLREYDLRRGERKFASDILAALALNSFDELVRWAQTADKNEIAALAPVVFAARRQGDPAAAQIIEAGASALAEYATAVAQRLGLSGPEIRLMGGLFENEDTYADEFVRALRIRGATVGRAEAPPEMGAVWLARGSYETSPALDREEEKEVANTEQANPRSARLEAMSARELVELFVAEEKSVEKALRDQTAQLAKAVELAGASLQNGGRIFYVGAGSSGRLGVLDAAEIPPTFGVGPERVQGIIAGGAPALHRSVEGAEDESGSGALALDLRGIGVRDLVIGISASGRAPFVGGALRRAREMGAKTVLLTCNAGFAAEVDLQINLPTGPEIIAGSTRLKAGTATKVALNIISTGAMVRLGRVRGNLMIDLQPTNRKLRGRAMRLVAQLAECDLETARIRLEKVGWNVRAALEEKGGV